MQWSSFILKGTPNSKKPLDLLVIMASNPDPVADYFTRFPHFTYDATTPAVAEFSRLAATSGWGRYSADYRRERGRFVDAFVEYVNTTYGEGRGNLTAWQALCRVCKINPAPTSITKCRKVRC